MPIIQGYSRKSIGANITTEMGRGKSYKVARAIALDIATNEANRRGKPSKAPKGRKS